MFTILLQMAQVAARTLGIDYKMITFQPGNSWACPNDYVTGGAHASDTVGYVSLHQIFTIYSSMMILRCIYCKFPLGCVESMLGACAPTRTNKAGTGRKSYLARVSHDSSSKKC